MPDYSVRSHEDELMDDPSVAEEDFRRALQELEVINRLLGGHAASLGGVRALLPPGSSPFSLLDVGTGGGDFPRRLVRWAAGRGRAAHVLGIDLLDPIVRHAREMSVQFPTVQYETDDIFSLREEPAFDIVHGAMVLHHLDDERAAEALRRMFAVSRRGVVVNDIHRHPLAYHSIRLLTRWLSRSRLVRHDAALSVLRAFRRGELEALVRRAELPAAAIRWRWAFRWQVVISR